jgi:ankyrin repeat protein
MVPPAMLCYARRCKFMANEGDGVEMGRGWTRHKRLLVGLVAAALLSAPAAAQFSDSYKFLKAVRDRDGAKVQETVNQPGSTLINAKDYGTGEAALHIVVKRRDQAWLSFLLAKGARTDIRDNDGNTPLAIAAQLGFGEGVQTLLEQGAGVNVANNRGETPLILAVHNRDLATVRYLIANGANPLQADRIAGKSARDYATEDRRSATILKLLDEAKPAKPKGKIAGPNL